MSNHVKMIIDTEMNIGSAKSSIDALQASINKMGLSNKFGDQLNQEFAKFNKAYDTYIAKVNSGESKTQSGYKATIKSLNEMKSAMSNIAKEASNIGKADPLKAFSNDKVISSLTKKIEELQSKIQNFKFDPSKLNGMFEGIKANISKSNNNIPNLMDQIMASNKAGNFDQTIAGLGKLETALQKSKQRVEDLAASEKDANKQGVYANRAKELEEYIQKIRNMNPTNLVAMQSELENLFGRLSDRAKVLSSSWQDFTGKVQQSQGVITKTADSLAKIHKEEFGMQRQIEMVDRQIQSYFGLSQILRKVANIARQAMQTVKELDKSMTETAVVTNFSVSDMWEKLPQYTTMANQLGATINDVYKATTLYYQQGLNMSQAMGIAEETLKMARIGGIDAAEATNMMTAALRGFNMQINEMSAQRVNDVYSQLAAMSASNTRELGEAMERTASIASSAGMEFGNTTAFLAQMIETTREAPENLGTAMKTIVARFQEMKKAPEELVSVEGEMLDANRVEKALKTVDIALREQTGDFRNLDEVFLEISSKWDQLSMGQQRYIATMAAGSRQQSRFIALMSNHERLMELVDGANNSAGASQEQFNKTLDSFATKANKLKNAWDQFTMGLLNDKLLKGAVDGLTNFMTILNKVINGLSAATGPFKGITKSILTLTTVIAGLSIARKGISAGVLGMFNWWSGKQTIGQLVTGVKEAAIQGHSAGNAYAAEFNKSLQAGLNFKTALNDQFNKKVFDQLQNRNNYTLANSNADGIVPTVAGQMLAMKSGDLAINADNLASIEGGLLQSLSSNEKFRQLGIEEGTKQVHEYVQALGEQWTKAGSTEGQDAAEKAKAARQNIANAVGEDALQSAMGNKAMVMSAGLQELTKSATQTGSAFTQLGYVLQGTPFAPLGTALTMVGRLMTSTVMIATSLGNAFTSLIVGSAALAGAETAEAAAQEKSNIAKLKALGLSGALKGIFLGMVPILLAIAAAIGLIWLAWNQSDGHQLKLLHDRAAAASDAYKSVKQEVSELKDTLKSLEENDTAFETLVSGTAEFNSKLIESNELISDLIKKYPELQSKGYITTDANGRMNVTQSGRDYLKKSAEQRQANTQALDILANADYQRQQTKMSKEYRDAEAAEKQLAATMGRGQKGTHGSGGAIYQRAMEQLAADNEATTESIMKAADTKIKSQQKTAVSAMLASEKDLIDRKSVANVIGESYQQIVDTIEADSSGKERAEAYAKAYGYEHISGNKFKDKEGNEIEVKKDIWNDETTNKRIKANEQIISSAETVDKTLDSLNGKVATAFDDIKIESDSLISDILSSNIETNQDELKTLLEKGDFEKLTEDLTSQQIEALKQAGIEDLDAVLEERGKAILDAQKQQDEDLGVMIAKAQNINADDFINNTTKYANQIAAIGNQIDALNAKEKNLLTTVGQGISDSLGDQNMGRFINTFIQGTQTVRNKLTSITKDVDWTSSISALGAVTKMTKSSSAEIKKLGQEMRTSAEGSHLLSDSMQEMFAAEDFQKATENMDNFVNSSGRLDATGVQKLAQESSTLNKLLKTDAISAGGLAAALNATSVSGVADVTSLNDSVLQLLSSFTQLETVMAEAHDIVSNFDPGIDTGEGVDFIKDAYEKASEYIKNGEWGNSQLESYMRLVAGDDAWTKALQDNNGNLEKTVKQLQPVLKKFENGYAQSWVNLAKGVDAYGNSIKDVKFKSKELQKLKLTEVNGGLELNVKESGATTEQVTKWIEKSYKVSSEVAKLMLADFKNMSPNLVPELEANDFYAGIKNGDFYNTNTIKTAGGNEIVALSKSTLDILSAATGKPIAEIETAIKNSEQARNKDIQILQNTYAKGEKKGELIDNYQLLNKRLSNLSEGQKQNKDRTDTLSWLKQFTSNNTIDITKALSYGERVGLDTSQTQGMLYEAFQALTKEGKEFEYNGQVINPSEVTSLGDFIDKLTKIDENENWNEVGAAIAEGYVNYIKGKEEQEQQEEEKEEKWESNSQSKAETYKVQPSSTKVLESRPELAAAATDEEIGDVGARAATFAKINKELKLTKAELADVNAGFIQLNMADLSTLSEDQLQQVFDMLGMTKKEAKSAKHDIDNFSALTDEQKEISIRTDISGEEKVSAMLQPILDEFGGDDTTKKTLIIEAAARMAEGKNDEAEELLKQAGIEGEELETVTKQIDFTVNAGLANPKEVQDSLNKEVDKACNLGSGVSGSKKAKIKKKVQIQYEEGGKKPKTRSTITTGIKVGKDEASAKVKELEKGGSASFTINANDKAALKKVNDIHDKAKKSETFDISANFIGNWKKDVVINVKKRKGSQEEESEATGVRQMGSIPSLPTFESLASGKHTRQLGTGQIGPKGNGGLTLTGELGYEIAWLPREGRSMILGANGPEMLNLPGDAVVWNHEQSKKIIKNNAIPTGSTAIGAGSAAFYPTGGGGTTVTTQGATTKSENKSNSKKGKSNKYQEKIIKQTWKLLGTAGKISNWWEDISRQVEGIQRIADRNQKEFKKLIDTAGTTLSDVQKSSETYSKSLQKSIQLNEEIVKHYKDKLDALTSGKGQSAKSRRGAVSGINKAANDVTKAEAKVELAKQTKSKKDDRKAKKNLRNAKKQLRNAKKKDKSAAVDTVTYNDEIQVTTKKKTRKGKGKWKNKTVKKKKKVKSTRAVDWSKIIEYDAETDTWILNDKEINKQAGGNKKAAKAIKEKGNKKINEMIQRRNSAQDKIDSARESLNQLADDTYNMFNRWEKSLTETYFISKKLETLQKTADVFKTQEEYISTKTTAGYRAPNALDQLTKILADKQTNLIQQALANADALNASFNTFQKSLNFDEYVENFLVGKIKEGKIEGTGETAKSQYNAASIAFEILRKAGLDKLETYDPEKAKQAYEEYAAKNFTNGTDDEVVKVLDRIAENQGNYLDTINETYGSITEIYSTLNEYEEYINEFEESLLKGLEEELNNEIDKQEKLNSALTNAFKNLLDEVKRRLDQRRQIEDNAKTESDIAKKQQRLATLRADTSGGHASEIAQLEQELAEAQQNYGRTLEDQLLERLREQGDKAAEQRERQIALLEIQRDLAQALGTNLEQVKELLENPEENYNKIKSLWLENQGYNEALPEQQKSLERQFEEEWDKYRAYSVAADNLREVLNSVNNPNEEYQDNVTTALNNIQQLLDDIIGKGIKQPTIQNNITSATAAKEKGLNAFEAYEALRATNDNASYKDLTEVYSAKDFKESNIGLKKAIEAGFEHEELKKAGYTAENYKAANVDYETAKSIFSVGELAEVGYEEAIQEKEEKRLANIEKAYNQFKKDHGSKSKDNKSKRKGKLSGKEFKQQIARGAELGYSVYQVATDLANTKALTWKEVLTAAKEAGYSAKTIKSWNPKATKTSAFRKAFNSIFTKGWSKYAQGGLATSTGPAWLDGTRAKPELVLNATDTKNFIALKDILSDVMGGISTISNSSNIESGPVNYDININVDHIANDYDVDKMAERIKKDIIKSASYRNVTAVSRLR